jgi:glyoxylase-like metal-dependent hydrolase (beta-lactamase superfamily II)
MSSISVASDIRIHALQTGTVAIKELQRDGGGRAKRSVLRLLADRRWTEPLPILAWLIEHPEGLIVVDTGETSRVAESGYYTRWNPYYRLAVREWVAPEDEIGPQIRRLGLSPDDVRWVVLTHLHTDHAGGLAHFPDSEIISSRAEFDFARGLPGKARGYLPQRWPVWFSPTLIEPAGAPFGPFADSMPLTAAGDVHILPTPGHTPGHLSVAVDAGDTVFLLAGDVSYSQQLMLDGVVDGVTADPATARATIGRIRRLVSERPTVYLPTHDPDSARRLTEREVVDLTHDAGARAR